MAEIKVPLIKGYPLGKDTLMNAYLRDFNTADLIECADESEKLAQTEDGPEYVGSPSLMANLMLARQIVRVGDIDGPFGLKELKRFEPVDYALLQAKADEMESAMFKPASKAVAKRGRPEGDGDNA